MGAPDTISDIIRRGIHDAYRTGWHRALNSHPDKPAPTNHVKED